MQSIAVAALIVSLTDQSLWGGLVAAASFLASGLVTPFGGVAADKHDRRRLLVISSSVQAVVAVALAALYVREDISPAAIVVAVAIEGLMVAIALPARAAMYPDIVPAERLADAAALGSISWNLGRTIGPGLAGLVLVVGDYSWIFVINAVTFVGTALAAALVSARQSTHTVTGSVWLRLRDGFAGAQREPSCWASMRMIAITALTISPFIALMPAVAQLVFHGDAVDTSHFVIAQGVGSVVGALLLSPGARRFGRYRMLLATFVLLPVVEILFAVSPNKELAVGGAFGLGWGYSWLLVGMNTIIQLRAPTEVRGRVLAIYFMTLSLFYPVGATVQGYLGDRVGIRETLAGGAALFIVALVIIAVSKPRWITALDIDRPSSDEVSTTV